MPTRAPRVLGMGTEKSGRTFRAAFWVDEEKDENGIPLKKMDVQYGQLYEAELDVKDVLELEVWVSGSLSMIGEPMIGK